MDDISISDFEALISIVSDIGIKEIDMLGGEPTLHPKFNQIIDLLSGTKLRTTISSNGSNINLLKNISEKYHKDKISIGISIYSDSIKRELHEYIVTYKPFLKSIFSKEHAIPEEAKNYIKTLFLEYYLIFMDTLSEGDLRDSLPFYVFFQEVNRLKNLYRHVNGVFCSGFIPDIENYPVLQYVRCPAGTTKLSVMPDGSVYPCYLFFRNREFRLGNILIDEFNRIWKNPVLEFFRKFEKNSCINTRCELFSLCHGGCPAISFMIFGSLNALDPRCVLSSAS